MNEPLASQQGDLFEERRQRILDSGEAKRKKARGIRLVREHNKRWLTRAREVAREICHREGEVHADAVRAVLYPRGEYPSDPNAWGAVFQTSDFEWTGRRVKSSVPQGRRNEIKVWILSDRTA